ncbi:hypothetical protein ZIOFF_029235 [Zingiber officinale]|uniref:DUF4408 domain-containing protein n=1 Tax=Zingiber officinale TaxID=94328 RepID=A0A8J5L421_ZINOF|nr:hypothetical protein ZIOFF_029235 [Zingiber officinale]
MAMEESWPSMIWSSVRSWFTPTVLFLLINLVIGTIVLTSSRRRRSHRRPHEDETAVAPHELPPLVRGPSAALERLRSLGLHRFRSGEFPFDTVAPIPESALPQPLARGPSALLDRLRSIGLNRFRSGEIPFDALPIPESDPPPAQTTDCITVRDDDDNVPDRKSRHYERIRSDSAGKEEAAGTKLAERMKKSASASSAFGRFEEAEIVRRPAASKGGRGSAVAEEEVEVDARADDFINRFRQQLQLQRLDSIMRSTTSKLIFHWFTNFVPDSQFPPFSSEIGSDDIILNQALEMGNESDEDHSKRTIWTVADDKLLAAAYTIMSEDSVVGNAQKNDREIRSRPIRQKTAKRKGKERVCLLDELNQAMQQSMAHLEEYNNNKKVDQLIQAHQLLVMDTRGMTDEQLHHLAICEQLKKKLNM